MKKINYTLLLLLSFTLSAFAQTPQAFNYQASLRDNAGQLLVSKPVSVRISIVTGSPDGPSAYTETHSVTTTNQGIVNLQVGRGTSSDLFSAIDWTSGTFFLKVEIDPDGGNSYITIGTSELLSVPFALMAKNSGMVNWENVEQKPVIPTNTNQLVNGAGFLTSFTETDPVFAASPASTISSSKISNWNSAYGWGNHANMGYAIYPLQTGNNGRFLSTNGTTTMWSYAVSNAGSPLSISNNFLNISQAGPTTDGYLSKTDWNLFNNKVSSRWLNEGNNMYFLEGNVGIGTNNPSRKLQVESYVQEGEIRDLLLLRNLSSSNTSYTGLNLRADDYNYGLGISFTSSNYNLISDFNQVASILTNGRALALSCSSTNGSIRLFTNPDGNGIIERLRITSEGYLGVGTITPAAKVEVADGDIYISDINKGIIMKSPDGHCWRGTLDYAGSLQFSSIPCP
jgi:hypothetical protein